MASKRDVEALLDRGLSRRQIAERIGAGVPYVNATLSRNGWGHRVRQIAKPRTTLREINAELLAVLKEVQWSAGEHGGGMHCPVCYANEVHAMDHKPACRLGKAIALAETKP